MPQVRSLWVLLIDARKADIQLNAAEVVVVAASLECGMRLPAAVIDPSRDDASAQRIAAIMARWGHAWSFHRTDG